MRVIGKFEKEDLALRFSMFLKKMGVENSYELEPQEGFSLWVYNEDEVEAARTYYQDFEKDPLNARYDVSVVDFSQDNPVDIESEIDEYERSVRENMLKKNRPIFYLTGFLLFLCSLIYILNFMQELYLEKKPGPQLLTPVQYYLMFDVPDVVVKAELFLKKYNFERNPKVEDMSPKARMEYEELGQMPYWKGVYDIVLSKLKNPKTAYNHSEVLFGKIRQFELWRLFSPAFLHLNFFHIFFNMIWLWILGKQIESRLSRFRFLMLVLFLALVTNVAQYLMSGPFFLGFSGVVMGMAGFIWSREIVAPWEGYTLNKSTVLFLLFFVAAIFLLQTVIFFLQLFTVWNFAPNIANTAHISGAVVGYLLGRCPIFAWRPIER